MAFTTTVRVRFGDEDHARIVYYPRFFHFFHCAFEDFFDQQGMPYRECLDAGVGWPAVHAEADYQRPVRFGDDLVFVVTLPRIGKSSATFRYVGTVAGADAPAVVGTVIVACIDMKTMRAQEIPARYRALFEPHVDTSAVVP
jgi:4-hydroxybenzoyl-CoA thioesterase